MTDEEKLGLLDYAGLPRTREAYIALNWLGQPPDPWIFEDEMELPEVLRRWNLFKVIGQ